MGFYLARSSIIRYSMVMTSTATAHTQSLSAETAALMATAWLVEDMMAATRDAGSLAVIRAELRYRSTKP